MHYCGFLYNVQNKNKNLNNLTKTFFFTTDLTYQENSKTRFFLYFFFIINNKKNCVPIRPHKIASIRFGIRFIGGSRHFVINIYLKPRQRNKTTSRKSAWLLLSCRWSARCTFCCWSPSTPSGSPPVYSGCMFRLSCLTTRMYSQICLPSSS